MKYITKISPSDVIRYYHSPRSRTGYKVLLNDTKHFGYYKKGDRFWQFNKALRQMENFLGKNFDLSTGSKILDAGCGTGDVSIYLAQNFGFEVDGIDLLDDSIRKANLKRETLGLRDKLSFKVGDYSKIHLDANHYDGIFTMETIVHIQDTLQVLKKFHSALKPGGRLILQEYTHASMSQLPPKLIEEINLISVGSAMPGFPRFEYGVLEKLVAQAGFKSVSRKDISKRVEPMYKVFYLLAIVPYTVCKVFGLDKNMPDAKASVVGIQNKKYFQYHVISAVK